MVVSTNTDHCDGWMVWKRTQASKDSEDQINVEMESAEAESENTELVNAMQMNPVFEDE